MGSLRNWIIGARDERHANFPSWVCERLGLQLHVGKIQLEAARPIFNPTEGKWPVAASFHKRFNELLCPGGEGGE